MNYNEVAQYCIDYLEGSLCVGMSMNSGLSSLDDSVLVEGSIRVVNGDIAQCIVC